MTLTSQMSPKQDVRCINEKRRLMIRFGGSAALLALLAPCTTARAETISLSTAINRSGKLRALSQRIAKGYTQLALGVLPEKALGIIADSQATVQRNIHELQLFGGTPELITALTALDGEAKKLIISTSKGAVKANALEISAMADHVWAGAEHTTQYYETLAKSPQARIVNLCGRQRMLSQRTAKCYMLIQAGFDGKLVREEMQNSRAQFNAAMETLLKAPISTLPIRQDLELAKQQWGAFQLSLDLQPNAAMIRNVATTSERVLELMDNLTNQYDSALKELLGEIHTGNKVVS